MSNTTPTQKHNTISITNSKKIVDLFAGTGAFSLAFSKKSEQFKTVFSNDFEKSSETIYNDNFPDSNKIADAHILLGSNYFKLNTLELAEYHWNYVIENFETSNISKKAIEKLKSLNIKK